MSRIGNGLRTAAATIDNLARAYALVRGGAGWTATGSLPVERALPLTDGPEGPRVIDFETVYRTQPMIFALVNTIAHQAARLPLRAYIGDPDGEYRPLPFDHPLPRLLRKPCPGKSAIDLKQWLIKPALIHGNSTIGKWLGDGVDDPTLPPQELLKLDWRFMAAYARTGGPIHEWASSQADGVLRSIDPSAVIHTCWDPPSGQLGVSPLEALGVTIASEEAVQRFERASFVNAVRPSGAVVLPKETSTSREERDEMRADMQKMFGGVDNAFRLALLTGGATFVPMSASAKEAALIETHARNLVEACITYDVPPPVVGELSKGSYNNVEELNRQRFKSGLPPWLQLATETLQAQLIDPVTEWADCFVRFDLGEVLKGDPVEEANAWGGLVDRGIASRDEARGRFGLRRRGGNADELTHQANNEALVRDAGRESRAADIGDVTLAAQRLGLAVRNGVLSSEEARGLIGFDGSGPTPDGDGGEG